MNQGNISMSGASGFKISFLTKVQTSISFLLCELNNLHEIQTLSHSPAT